jgi:hypothetical protein
MIGVSVTAMVAVAVGGSGVDVNASVGGRDVKVEASVGGKEVDVGAGSFLFIFEIRNGMVAAIIVATAPIMAMIMF